MTTTESCACPRSRGVGRPWSWTCRCTSCRRLRGSSGMAPSWMAFRHPCLIWHTDVLAAGSRARGSPEHAIRHRPNNKEHTLKKDLHPTYVATTVTCTCGNTFETRSTVQGGKI